MCTSHASYCRLTLPSRFIMADYALHGALEGSEQVQRRVLAYDIGCQYSINLEARFQKQFPITTVSDLEILVGKMHVRNHVEECHWRCSLNYTPGVGRLDGEVAERWWSEANQLAGSTKQMNPGHREDTLNDHINDWNRRKMQGYGEYFINISLSFFLRLLIAKAAERALTNKVYRTVKELRSKFEEFDAAVRLRYGEDVISSWENMGIQPYVSKDGIWDSAFRCKTCRAYCGYQYKGITHSNVALAYAEVLKKITLGQLNTGTIGRDNGLMSFLATGMFAQQLQ